MNKVPVDNLKLSGLVFAIILPLLTFAPEAKAQWVSVGRSIEGQPFWVSRNFWYLRNSPNVRIFYSKTPLSTQPRGSLTAVNCNNMAYTFDVIDVNGDGKFFRVSRDEYSWTIPSSDSIGAAMVEYVCEY